MKPWNCALHKLTSWNSISSLIHDGITLPHVGSLLCSNPKSMQKSCHGYTMSFTCGENSQIRNELIMSVFLFIFFCTVSEVLEKSRFQIDVLRELYKRLCEILSECPGQYYRWEYLGSWVIVVLLFFHTPI